MTSLLPNLFSCFSTRSRFHSSSETSPDTDPAAHHAAPLDLSNGTSGEAQHASAAFEPASYQQKLGNFLKGIVQGGSEQDLLERFQSLLAVSGARAMEREDGGLDAHHAAMEQVLSKQDEVSLRSLLEWIDAQRSLWDARLSGMPSSSRLPLACQVGPDGDHAIRELSKLRAMAAALRGSYGQQESLSAVAEILPHPSASLHAPVLAELKSSSIEARAQASQKVDALVLHLKRLSGLAKCGDSLRSELPMLQMRVATFLRQSAHLLSETQLQGLARCDGLGLPMTELCASVRTYQEKLGLCLQVHRPEQFADALAMAVREGLSLHTMTAYYGGTHTVSEAREDASSSIGASLSSAIADLTAQKDRRELGRLHVKLQTAEFRALGQALDNLSATPVESLPVDTDSRLLPGMVRAYRTIKAEAARAIGKSPAQQKTVPAQDTGEASAYLCGSGKVLDPVLYREFETPSMAQPSRVPDERDKEEVRAVIRDLDQSDLDASSGSDDEYDEVVYHEDNPAWVHPDKNHNADMRKRAMEAVRGLLEGATLTINEARQWLTEWQKSARPMQENPHVDPRTQQVYLSLNVLHTALRGIDRHILQPHDLQVIQEVIKTKKWTIDRVADMTRILDTTSGFNSHYLDPAADEGLLKDVKAHSDMLGRLIAAFDNLRPKGPNPDGFRGRNAPPASTSE